MVRKISSFDPMHTLK